MTHKLRITLCVVLLTGLLTLILHGLPWAAMRSDTGFTFRWALSSPSGKSWVSVWGSAVDDWRIYVSDGSQTPQELVKRNDLIAWSSRLVPPMYVFWLDEKNLEVHVDPSTRPWKKIRGSTISDFVEERAVEGIALHTVLAGGRSKNDLTTRALDRHFEIPADASRVVVSLEWRANTFEEPARIEVFADGRVVLKGGLQLSESHLLDLEDLRSLIEPIVLSGLLDVEERELARRQLRLTRNVIDDAPGVVYEFNVDGYRVGNYAHGPRSTRLGLTAPTLFKLSDAFMADPQMRALVELTERLESYRVTSWRKAVAQ